MAEAFTAAALALFLVGMYCIIRKRNLIKIVVGIEIMTAAVNLNFISMAWNGEVADPLAASIVLISIAIAAAIAAFALSLIIKAFKHTGSVDSRKLRRLRW
jgi:multicomponent Na+:H+ antiporter subunit C